MQLETAICKNTKLYAQVKAYTIEQSHLVVAGVVAAVLAVAPQLALFGGLLTVVGVLVAKAGIEAFCRLMRERRASGS